MRKIISIIFKIIGWPLVVIGFVCFFARICFSPLYEQFNIPGSIVGAAITFIIGYGLRELGYRIGKPKNSEESLVTPSQEITPKKQKPANTRKKIQWRKIMLSVLLFGIFAYCLGCGGEGDSITAFMIVVYIPFYGLLFYYYMRLIWKYGRKITRTQILLLPILQKINILQDYKEDITDRKRLFSTSFYGLVLSVLCPAIISTMYYDMNHHIHEYYGICYFLLFLPILVWIISLSKGLFYDWLLDKRPSDNRQNHDI